MLGAAVHLAVGSQVKEREADQSNVLYDQESR